MKHQHPHRSRSEIIAAILEVANGNRVRLTELLYKTYLSHGVLKEYLLLLFKTNLIEYIQGERTYKTTEKGVRFLRIYDEMGELIVVKAERRQKSSLKLL